MTRAKTTFPKLIFETLKVLLVFLVTTVVATIVVSLVIVGSMGFLILSVLAILWTTT